MNSTQAQARVDIDLPDLITHPEMRFVTIDYSS